jgi:DNA-binding NtrC family response regulator
LNSAGKSWDPDKKVFLIDPEESFATILRTVLGPKYIIDYISTIAGAVARLKGGEGDVLLLNWDWPKQGPSVKEQCAELLKVASSLAVPIPVIVFTWDARREVAMDIIRQGAFDFFIQPLDIFDLRVGLDRAYRRVASLRDLEEARKLISSKQIDGLLGNSKGMQRIGELISKVAGACTTILVRGESGTGKEVVARAIHRLSSRASKPFIAFSPSALPDTLIEDELFGHEKGAFTGAWHGRRGRFEEAQGGTVFLDEIGDLAHPMQAKLLRVLQERSLERLGSNVPTPLDVRLICATNRDLEQMVREGIFRQDLYFRISVFRIDLPPLRERRDDIPLLAEYFRRQFAEAHKKNVQACTPELTSALVSYHWPGNVRQLQNVIERSVILAEGHQLRVTDLPPEVKPLAVSSEVPGGSFHEAVRCFKREMVLAALRAHSGNKLRAARELRISRCYLHRLLNQFGISCSGGTPSSSDAPAAAADAATVKGLDSL